MFNHRNDTYQQVSFSDIKHRIDTHLVELRKTRRSMEFKQKRIKYGDRGTLHTPPSILKYFPSLDGTNFRCILHHLKLILESPPDETTFRDALSMLRTEIYQFPKLPQDYVEANMIEICLKVCTEHRSPEIISDACIILSNISSGPTEYSLMIVQKDGISVMIRAIEHLQLNDCEDPIWLLANLSVEGTEIRNSMRDLGILSLLKQKIQETEIISRSLIIVLVWFYSAHFKEIYEEPVPETSQILEFILNNFIPEDNCTFIYSLKASASICQQNENIGLMFEFGIIKYLKIALSSEETSICIEGLNLMLMICSGDAKYILQLVNHNLLDYLESALRHKESSIRQKACWAISNIAGGNFACVQLLKNHPVFNIAIDCVFDASTEVRLEAAHVLYNILYHDTEDYQDFLSIIHSALSSYQDVNFLSLIVNACSIVLDKMKTSKELFESSGCLAEIEKCSNSSNMQVSKESLQILKTHFS